MFDWSVAKGIYALMRSSDFHPLCLNKPRLFTPNGEWGFWGFDPFLKGARSCVLNLVFKVFELSSSLLDTIETTRMTKNRINGVTVAFVALFHVEDL